MSREEAKALKPGDEVQTGYHHCTVVAVLEVPEKGRHVHLRLKNNAGTTDRWCYLGSLIKGWQP